MVMSVPWLNYPLTIEALTGGGGGGGGEEAEINLLVPQKSKFVFLGSMFPNIFFVCLFPSKVALTSSVPLK